VCSSRYSGNAGGFGDILTWAVMRCRIHIQVRTIRRRSRYIHGIRALDKKAGIGLNSASTSI